MLERLPITYFASSLSVFQLSTSNKEWKRTIKNKKKVQTFELKWLQKQKKISSNFKVVRLDGLMTLQIRYIWLRGFQYLNRMISLPLLFDNYLRYISYDPPPSPRLANLATLEVLSTWFPYGA